MKNNIYILFYFLISYSNVISQNSNLVYKDSNGKLIYTPDERGNVLPDFSSVGYFNSEKSIPVDIRIVKTISPVEGDNFQLIQNAIDEVASLPPDSNGFRGVIMLNEGLYNVSQTIKINKSGIVLRGKGEKTHLFATGTTQYNLIEINSNSTKSDIRSTRKEIVDDFLPIGSKNITIDTNHSFSQGDWVNLYRVPNKKWLNLLGVDSLSRLKEDNVDWDTITYTIGYERRILYVEGNNLLLDAPVMDVIDSEYSSGYIVKIADRRINNCGVENMKLSCTYSSPIDENHAWIGVFIDKAAHCFVRNVSAYHFGFGCVSISRNASFITVDSCSMIDPISVLGGSRRYSFNVNGQRCLIMNCYTKGGRHDFAHGARVAGPNVFYNNVATFQKSDIGPHQRWTTGTLFDKITGDGVMTVQNRYTNSSGHGWTGGQIAFWNCTASKFILHDPPSDHTNWLIGCIGEVTNMGLFKTEPLGVVESHNTPIEEIPSLFIAQLNERLSNLPDLEFELISNDNDSINYYTEDDIDLLISDMNADAYEIYELTTSGGEYVLDKNGLSPIISNKSFTLRAADNLSEKPVISYSVATNSKTRYMFYPNVPIKMTFEGIEINGHNPERTSMGVNEGVPNFTRITKANTMIVIRNCYFHDFSHTVGLFRVDAAGVSFDIQETLFKNCVGNILNFQTANLAYGDVLLKNNTFTNMVDATAAISYANGASGSSLSIDHCTFNEFNTTRDIFVLKEIKGMLKIQNSIFNKIQRGFNFSNPIPVIDYSYLEGFALAPSGDISNSFKGNVPNFRDVISNDYGLTNYDLFICGDGLPAGNTMYYNLPLSNEETFKSGVFLRIIENGNTFEVLRSGVLEVFNINGVRLSKQKVFENTSIELNKEKGIYILKLEDQQGNIYSRKLILY